MSWSRPVGSPRVWGNVAINNSKGEKMFFSLEEIPEERYDEVLEHMTTVFVKDETLCGSVNIIDEPESIAAFKTFWSVALSQGISIAAYEQIGNNNEAVLAGLNILVVNDTKPDLLAQDLPPRAKKILHFAEKVCGEKDLKELFNINCYLIAYGLSVLPKYRGIGLGKHILEMRKNICRAYDIPLTSTLFTGAASQRLAERVGFKDLIVRAYDDVIDGNGQILFPSLKGKQFKVMYNQFL